MEDLKARLRSLPNQLDRATGGVFGIVTGTFESFGEARAAQAAAGLAYYTFFSMFPLLLFLVSLGSLFLEQEAAYQQVMDYIAGAIPVSRSLIDQNLQQVLETRGAVGFIGLVGALWSASGAFTVLANNVNIAWPTSERRGFIKGRLVALAMIGVLVLFLLVSAFSTTIIGLVAGLRLPLVDGLATNRGLVFSLISRLVSLGITWLLFLALYRWVPNVSVRWRWAAIGAAVSAVLWEAATALFTWYVYSGLAGYRIVYGSLGALVALLFWIYLGSWIMLFGAHLSAVVARRAERG